MPPVFNDSTFDFRRDAPPITEEAIVTFAQLVRFGKVPLLYSPFGQLS